VRATGLAVEGRVLVVTEELARTLAEAAELLEAHDNGSRRRSPEVTATLQMVRWWARQDAGAHFDDSPAFPPPFPSTEAFTTPTGNGLTVVTMSATEAADRLNVTAARARQLARAGTLPAAQVAGRWQFDTDAVDAYASERGL
jgi:excisionase family DNA binding protein